MRRPQILSGFLVFNLKEGLLQSLLAGGCVRFCESADSSKLVPRVEVVLHSSCAADFGLPRRKQRNSTVNLLCPWLIRQASYWSSSGPAIQASLLPWLVRCLQPWFHSIQIRILHLLQVACQWSWSQLVFLSD